ncbi:MAG: hypothetical protein A2X64_02730 [Ignavibacteria bacterium GWF2_33_9]|nr:MAG: hypothetical protein A2X64_02730 [Ignavibacteria bacterium GWF2_33_9]
MNKLIQIFILIFLMISLSSCSKTDINFKPAVKTNISENPVNGDKQTKKYFPKILKKFPHNPSSYTQGLIFHNGDLYEGTGQYGSSKLMKINLKTGYPLKSLDLLPVYFGEGITIFNNKIYQLTWQSNKGFIYDINSLKKIGEFTYPTEGWGITNDSTSLIVSDGSNFLNFYDPINFSVIKTIMVVRKDDTPVYNLNELEFINGMVFANVYMTNEIIVINPNTGVIEASIDVSELRYHLDDIADAEVANGIAYNDKTNTYFLTGKYWSNLFEVKLIEE